MTGDEAGDLTEALKTLRELQLHLNFFNLGFADVLWGCKLFYLSTTILAGFSAIRLIHTNPVYGCLYAYQFLLGNSNCINIFGFAYKVTEKLEGLVQTMETVSGGLVNAEERKFWARVLRSIPRMGMKVGGFSQGRPSPSSLTSLWVKLSTSSSQSTNMYKLGRVHR